MMDVIKRMRILKQIIIGLLLINTVAANNLLHQADSLYIRQNYVEALNRYRTVLDHDRFLEEDFTINFKLAFCYLKNNNYTEAREIFQKLKSGQDKIPAYTDYFLFLCRFHQDKSGSIITNSRKFLTDHVGHFLADSVLIKIADYKFKIKRFNEAFSDYARLSGRKGLKSLRPYFLAQMSLCRLYTNKKDDALERMYQVMKKYPSDPAALKMANLFESYTSVSDKYEFAIAEVYLKHGESELLTSRMENFIKRSEELQQKEKARYYLIRIYYRTQQYQTALYGYKNLLSGLKNKSLESRLRLAIARCYLRLGENEKAVKAYLDYAKRYPRRRMAVECSWKAGWIYEELGQISNTLGVYKQMLKHWPRSQYRHEANFRVGLSYLKLGQYTNAQAIFKGILSKNLSEFHHTRSSYWLAKTYAMQGMAEKSEKILIALGAQLFDSYYSLKSYRLYESQIDMLYQIKEKLADTKNPLRFYTDSMAPLMEKFEELFLIRELMGEDIALRELSEKKYYPKTLKGWISLAEIYKKLRAYNHAFKIYDYINNKHFADLPSLDKPFLMKESYPLYYDNIVGNFGVSRDLDKNLVLALIRAESSFNRRAHSGANAFGLMQIIPRTAKSLAMQVDVNYKIPSDLFNPELNINLGSLYLKNLLDQFDNTQEYAIAAYNAGPHRVSRWLKFKYSDDIDFFVENIEYTQTRNYVRRVMRNYWIYQLLDIAN